MPHCNQGDCRTGCFGRNCSCSCDDCMEQWKALATGVDPTEIPKPQVIPCTPTTHSWTQWDECLVNWRGLQVFTILVRVCSACEKPEFKEKPREQKA